MENNLNWEMSETRSLESATPSWTQMISEMIKNTIKIKIKYHLFKNKMYGVIGLAMKNSFRFATAKKTKMELTIRTPYRTIVSNFDGFSRVLAKTNEVLILDIQTRHQLLSKTELPLPHSSFLQEILRSSLPKTLKAFQETFSTWEDGPLFTGIVFRNFQR